MLPRFVTIGGCTKSDLLDRVKEAGVQMNEFGQNLFQDVRFTTEPEARRLEVLGITVAELGLADGGTYSQVLEIARSRGLEVCPLELAAHLRLQWLDQPEAPIEQSLVRHRAPPGSVTVMTEAPPDDQDVPWGFYLRRVESQPWLRGYRSWSGHIKAAQDFLVFVRIANAA